MLDETLDAASDGLADTRGKIQVVREVLQALLDDQEVLDGLEPVREAVERLDRLTAGVARVEAVVEGQRVEDPV